MQCYDNYLVTMGKVPTIFPQFFVAFLFFTAFSFTSLASPVRCKTLAEKDVFEEEEQLAPPSGDAEKAYKRSLRKYDGLLTDEEKQDLFQKLAQGAEGIDDANEQLVGHNQGLVMYVANRYMGRGLDFLDLVQEGNRGLIRAIEKFDIKKDNAFSTYATNWIISFIKRALDEQGKVIRVPSYVVESIREMNLVEYYLFRKLKRKPSVEETAEEMGVPVDKVKNWKGINRQSESVVSLDKPIGNDDEGDPIRDFIPDPQAVSPVNKLVDAGLSEQIDAILSTTLTILEERVLRMRLGIGQRRSYNIKEISNILYMEKKKIEQLEFRAIRKIRGSRESMQLLRPYYEDLEKNVHLW